MMSNIKNANKKKGRIKNYILFDLEAVITGGADDFMEIIEIGAHKIEVVQEVSDLFDVYLYSGTTYNNVFSDKRMGQCLQANCVLKDSFHTYVKPVHHTKMTKRLGKLLGMDKDFFNKIRKTAPKFEEAMNSFLEWAGKDAIFVSWSSNDEDMIYNNYEKNYIFEAPGLHFMDLQYEYDKVVGNKLRTGLKRAMEENNLVFMGQEHTALADAYNMIHIFQLIMSQNRKFANQIQVANVRSYNGNQKQEYFS